MNQHTVATLTAYDPATLRNAVTVNGRDLVDLLVLATPEAWTLRAGHRVLLMPYRSSYVILGRVLP
jgi:hypothetical protein